MGVRNQKKTPWVDTRCFAATWKLLGLHVSFQIHFFTSSRNHHRLYYSWTTVLWLTGITIFYLNITRIIFGTTTKSPTEIFLENYSVSKLDISLRRIWNFSLEYLKKQFVCDKYEVSNKIFAWKNYRVSNLDIIVWQLYRMFHYNNSVK